MCASVNEIQQLWVQAHWVPRTHLPPCVVCKATVDPDPQFTPHHARQGHSAPKWVSHMSMIVFTLKCVCATMVAVGFQPQTCSGAWCVMRWRTRCD